MERLKLLSFLLFISVCSISAQPHEKLPISKSELKDTLLVLLSLDTGPERFRQELLEIKQRTMSTWIDSLLSLPTPEQRRYAKKKFLEIVSHQGLPSKEEIGTGKSFEALAILTIHSGELDFMKEQLPKLRQNFAPRTIAVLEDKISVLEETPQRYGSQVLFSVAENRPIFYEILDPFFIDQRREAIGLNSLEDYAKEVGINWEKEKKRIFK